MKQEISAKDAERREFVLSAPMWRVIPYICFPLVLYQAFSQLFKIVDNVMASHIGSTSVSAVAWFTQINQFLIAIGAGLAVGGSILISRYYGEGNYKKVKIFVNTIFAMCVVLSLLVLLLIPIAPTFLTFFGTPKELLDEGFGYFVVGLFDIIITFFNTVYIAIERARGNSKRILVLNIFCMIVKLILTFIFVYLLNSTITMIALAGIFANCCILIPGIIELIRTGGAFGLSIQSVSFSKENALPILKLGVPVMVEKVSFALGKISVNSMSAVYGSETVGALGVSNNLGGFTTSLQNGFQEGCVSVIGQNIGAKKYDRALQAFRVTLLWTMAVGILGYAFSTLFMSELAGFFAPSDNDFKELIMFIFRYEALGVIPLGLNVSAMALLYGFGYTKLTFVVNFCRVLVFRVPVLWALQQFTSIGVESVGIVMMFSNFAVSFLSAIIALVIYSKVKREFITKN